MEWIVSVVYSRPGVIVGASVGRSVWIPVKESKETRIPCLNVVLHKL